MNLRQEKFFGRKLVATITVFLFVVSLNSSAFGIIDAPATTTAAAVAPVTGDASIDMPKAGNVTVNFKDVDIKTILHYLSEVSGVDIIPAPGVEGNVTMRLRNKPWQVALDIVTRNYGYAYSKDEEQGIIRVMPKGQLHSESPVTEVIPLNNLVREIELSKSGSSTASEEIIVQQKEESINRLMSAINSMLDENKGEKATFIPSVNAIIVTAIPARISEIKSMVSKIDKRTAQIILDTKVIEITLTDDERFGVDWNAIIRAAGAKRPITFPFTSTGKEMSDAFKAFLPQSNQDNGVQFPRIDTTTAANMVNPTTFTSSNNSANLFSFGTLDFSTFTATLSLLNNRGDTEVLSAPRITTLDNQKASIKVVDKIMLQKTQEATQTANVVTVEFEKEADAREVGIKLTVIPHVNEDGDISVNLLPEVSNPKAGTQDGFQSITAVGAIQTVALTFSSREANTIVRARDGETIFLGGLIKKNVILTENKLPILGDLLGGIPVLGNAFKYEAENVQRTEIVFFVTLHIVQDAKDSIKDSQTEDFYERYFLHKDKSVIKDYEGAKKNVFKKVQKFNDELSEEDVAEASITPAASQEAMELNKKRIAKKRSDKSTGKVQKTVSEVSVDKSSGDVNVVKTGKWQYKNEETVQVPLPAAGSKGATGSKSKPWFDFRK